MAARILTIHYLMSHRVPPLSPKQQTEFFNLKKKLPNPGGGEKETAVNGEIIISFIFKLECQENKL